MNQPNAPLFVPASEGVQIIARVAAAEDEPAILKNNPHSFRGTPWVYASCADRA